VETITQWATAQSPSRIIGRRDYFDRGTGRRAGRWGRSAGLSLSAPRHSL